MLPPPPERSTSPLQQPQALRREREPPPAAPPVPPWHWKGSGCLQSSAVPPPIPGPTWSPHGPAACPRGLGRGGAWDHAPPPPRLQPPPLRYRGLVPPPAPRTPWEHRGGAGAQRGPTLGDTRRGTAPSPSRTYNGGGVGAVSRVEGPWDRVRPPPPFHSETCGMLVTNSKHTSAQEILVSGTIGAFRLCTDELLAHSWTYRGHSVKLILSLFFYLAMALALQVLCLRFLDPAKSAAVMCNRQAGPAKQSTTHI